MGSELSEHAQYVAILEGAVERIEQALTTLRSTAEALAEVGGNLRQVTAGTAIADLPELYTEVESEVRALVAGLENQVASVKGYMVGVGGTTASPPISSTQTQAAKSPADSPSGVTSETVEQLKRQLPDPIRPDDRGRKTHGRWVGPDGKVHETVSGRDEDASLAMKQLQEKGIPRKPLRTSDVEMKLAARMADKGITEATVVINNTPCEGILSCDTLVPILLPDGSTLTVHGVEPDGTPFVKRYEGGARPWWH